MRSLGLINNNEAKYVNVSNANAMVKTLGSTHIEIKDYARLHAAIHYQTGHQGNIMPYPLVAMIQSNTMCKKY